MAARDGDEYRKRYREEWRVPVVRKERIQASELFSTRSIFIFIFWDHFAYTKHSLSCANHISPQKTGRWNLKR